MKHRASSLETKSGNAPASWEREPHSPCLRIETESGDLHVFPYHHLLTASLTQASNADCTLLVSFSTHDVELKGCGLRDLLLGIQEFAIKWVRPVPERYRGIASSQCGFVYSIRIVASSS